MLKSLVVPAWKASGFKPQRPRRGVWGNSGAYVYPSSRQRPWGTSTQQSNESKCPVAFSSSHNDSEVNHLANLKRTKKEKPFKWVTVHRYWCRNMQTKSTIWKQTQKNYIPWTWLLYTDQHADHTACPQYLLGSHILLINVVLRIHREDECTSPYSNTTLKKDANKQRLWEKAIRTID